MFHIFNTALIYIFTNTCMAWKSGGQSPHNFSGEKLECWISSNNARSTNRALHSLNHYFLYVTNCYLLLRYILLLYIKYIPTTGTDMFTFVKLPTLCHYFRCNNANFPVCSLNLGLLYVKWPF
jgi:hypothetical protein